LNFLKFVVSNSKTKAHYNSEGYVDDCRQLMKIGQTITS
jgi:hypothetical protein